MTFVYLWKLCLYFFDNCICISLKILIVFAFQGPSWPAVGDLYEAEAKRNQEEPGHVFLRWEIKEISYFWWENISYLKKMSSSGERSKIFPFFYEKIFPIWKKCLPSVRDQRDFFLLRKYFLLKKKTCLPSVRDQRDFLYLLRKYFPFKRRHVFLRWEIKDISFFAEKIFPIQKKRHVFRPVRDQK